MLTQNNNTRNTENTNNTNNTNNTRNTMSELILKPRPYKDIEAVHRHLFQMNDGSLEFGQDTEPRFTAPVLRDKNGKFYLDKDNIEWLDKCTDEEKKEIFDEIERNEVLKGLYNNIQPVDNEPKKEKK